MLQVKENSRQVPKIKKYTADKSYNDLVYSWLQLHSEMFYVEDIEDENGVPLPRGRFIRKNVFTFTKLGEELGISRQTAAKYFKNLITLDLIQERPEGYILKGLDKDVASLIPFETLRVINNSLNQNAVSLYIYILKRYMGNQQQGYIITHNQMKDFIGISQKTRSNDYLVSDILLVLSKLKLIKYKVVFNEEEVKKNFMIEEVYNVIQ